MQPWLTSPAGNCPACGAALYWRQPTARSKTGKPYKVESTGQWHHKTCPAKKSAGTPYTPAPVGYVPPTGIAAAYLDAIKTGTAPVEAATAIFDEAFPAAPATSNGSNDDLAALLAKRIGALLPKPEIHAALDAEAVRAIVREMLPTIGDTGKLSVVVSVAGSDMAPKDMGRQHPKFPLLCKVIGRRRNVFLAGPAGSGKTTACEMAARAFDMPFGSISVGPQTTQAALFGFIHAAGLYVSTVFRTCFEHGGVFLLDEIDRGNPGVITALNQALANGRCAFPDGMIDKHPNFVCVAAGNTFGNGADREYVGAVQLDAATLDRFAFIDWPYDEQLEAEMTFATFEAAGGTDRSIAERWLAKVRNCRAKAKQYKIRAIFGPRSAMFGADLLASGVDESDVAAMYLWKGLDADSIARLQ